MRRWLIFLAAGLTGALGLTPATSAGSTAAPPRATMQHPFCASLGQSIQASAGAQAWCFRAQHTGPAQPSGSRGIPFGTNVDAANPREDVSPSGVQAYGQSEVSIAAVDNYVVEAWNDATGFLSPCPSPKNKEELTGYGFSANGGKSFTDEGGLPNSSCKRALFGDPSVEAWTAGGNDYFYVSSLYDRLDFAGQSYLAINACQATGTGPSASISCGEPILAAKSTQCHTFDGFGTFCSFLDKEFLAIDPQRGRLYMAYTEFGIDPSTTLVNGSIDLAVCDIGTPAGGVGPAGGTAAQPVCEPDHNATPYLAVGPGTDCENEGAYPAVDQTTGDVYVGWEYNWATNFFGGPCLSEPTKNKIRRVPFSCLTLTPASGCTPASLDANAVNVKSMDAAFIPGYNRFPGSDFPRLAVSETSGTVSMVWNDTRFHPLGDILLQSFSLGSLSPVQPSPVVVNEQQTGGLHFLPALRHADQAGKLAISWYERNTPNTAFTDVKAALGVDPTTTTTPTNLVVTTEPTDWNAVSSDIIPNFGDYTDNYVIATSSAPYSGHTDFVAWSDGRIGDPQPFEAKAGTL